MRTGLGIFGGLVLFVVILMVSAFGMWAWRYYTAEVRGRVDAQEQIQSGDNRIVQYNHFFNLCASIQGNEAQIDSLNAALLQVAPDDTRERNRLNASLAGVRAARLAAIARYNADALKDYTAGQFRDSDLPYQIPATSYPEGGPTSCAAS